MSWPGVPELLLLAIVILLLFGGSKLKDIMKSFGEGLREFRKATEEPAEQLQRTFQAPSGSESTESGQDEGDTEDHKPQDPAG